MTDQQLGPYTIQHLIGRGGMADVYLAWDRAERWPVALKVLRANPGKDARLGKRFEREAELLLKLRHPHIVQVYRAGHTPDGHAYIAMEYVAGGDLEELMRRKPGAKLPVSEAIYLMRRVAGAMAYAHEQDIVHRDLKPGNVLLRADSGEPVVADLGIAALAGANRLTGTLESVGTPQYMAPEQAAGDQPTDGRADIYAIGVMLYELLTGRPPFEAENGWAILTLKRERPAPPLLAARPGLSPQLAAVVDACLLRDPAARPQTAAALAAALDAFLPADARPPAPPPARKGVATPRGAATPTPTSTSPARRPVWLWAGGAALALLLLLAVIFPILGGGGRAATATPTVSGVAQTSPTTEEKAEPTGAQTAAPKQPTSTLAAPAAGEPGEPTIAVTAAPTLSLSLTRTPTRQSPLPVAGATTVRAIRDVYTRSGPGLTYPTFGGLSRNEAVTVLGRNDRGDWYLVESARGPVWVYEDYITVVAGALAAVDVAATIPAPATLTPTATPTIEGTGIPLTFPPITLLEPPPFACPPGPGAPAYSANDTITFRWEWPADLPAESYLEVRAGLVGRIISQGRVDPAAHRQGNRWAFPVSGSAVFRSGDGDYQWAVYLVGDGGRVLLNSSLSCFGLVGNATGGTPVTPVTPVTPNADSDGDGVPDTEDQCPGEPAGDTPDPERLGCPMPLPPLDSDNDGIPDTDDWCPYERPGPYPDPDRPGCPDSYP